MPRPFETRVEDEKAEAYASLGIRLPVLEVKCIVRNSAMMKRIKSDFLFAQPSSMSGVASTIDLWGQLTSYNTSESAQEADQNAIAADWFVTGQDIEDALKECASAL